MLLSRLQRNDVFAAVTDVGFSPSDFDVRVLKDEDTVLTHRDSNSYFVWGLSRLYGGGETSVRIDTRIEQGEREQWTPKYSEWPTLLRVWLHELKQELETPDLWAALKENRDAIAALPASEENTPFTPTEQAEITKQLAEIKARVSERADLTEGQKRVLDEHLDYLDEATGRMGRVDWRNLAYGVLLSDIVNAVLPPEAVRSVLMMLLQAVAHLFGHPLPTLPTGR